MTSNRLFEINYRNRKPTCRELRAITFNVNTEKWEIKGSRHRAACKARRKRNRVARESRRVNKGR